MPKAFFGPQMAIKQQLSGPAALSFPIANVLLPFQVNAPHLMFSSCMCLLCRAFTDVRNRELQRNLKAQYSQLRLLCFLQVIRAMP